MYKQLICLIISLFVSSNIIYAQTDTTFYKDSYLSKECNPAKANYISFMSTDASGRSIKEVQQIKGNITLQKELSTGEPIGLWHYKKNQILDFDFSLQYSDEACREGVMHMDKPFSDSSAIGYVAPLLDPAYRTIFDFLAKNVVYPVYARDHDISGRVNVRFVITSTGRIQHIEVIKSAHVSLDKEAVRVLKKLNLSSPPRINGKPSSICVSVPVSFNIQK